MAKRSKKPPAKTPAELAAQAVIDQTRTGMSQMSVAGRTVALLTPQQRLDALERLEQRAAARTVPVVESLDDGWTL